MQSGDFFLGNSKAVSIYFLSSLQLLSVSLATILVVLVIWVLEAVVAVSVPTSTDTGTMEPCHFTILYYYTNKIRWIESTHGSRVAHVMLPALFDTLFIINS